MITPTDLILAWAFGAAAGLLIPTILYAVRYFRARRADQLERTHWKALAKFRG